MHVFYSAEFFNIMPNVTSFLGACMWFGNIPNLEFLGHYPDIGQSNAKNNNIINILLFHHIFQTRKEQIPKFITLIKTPPLFIAKATISS